MGVHKRLALLFPGQGAQYVGMGRDLFDVFPVVRATFEEADDLLKESLSRTIFEGPAERLAETYSSQLAIFTMSAALFRLLRKEWEITPAVCAGLSLGEYTALFAAQLLSFEETLALIAQRGRLMDLACRERAGTMAVVLGMPEALLTEIVAQGEDLFIANYNTPDQSVLSGTKEAVEQGVARLQERGVKRILPLSVQGAFHTPLMASAETQLIPCLDQVSFTPSSSRLVMNVPGDFVFEEQAIRTHLKAQMTHPVRWYQGIQAIERWGVEGYLEVGCGKTLSAMNRKMGVTAPTFSLERLSEWAPLVQRMAKPLEAVR